MNSHTQERLTWLMCFDELILEKESQHSCLFYIDIKCINTTWSTTVYKLSDQTRDMVITFMKQGQAWWKNPCSLKQIYRRVYEQGIWCKKWHTKRPAWKEMRECFTTSEITMLRHSHHFSKITLRSMLLLEFCSDW